MSDIKRTGRPSHQPTDKDRKMVEAMVSYGIQQHAICAILDIDTKTLRKHYEREIATATSKANSLVAQTLFRKATDPSLTSPSVTAAMFWMRARAGWRTSDPAPTSEVVPEIVGKKAQIAAAAETAGLGTDWGDDLTPPGLAN